MKHTFQKFLALGFVFFFGQLSWAADLSSNRFFGVLEHTQMQKQQLARLDLVTSRGPEDELQINAILTLHFGDFRSREYITYHYENVRFDPIAGRMTLEQADQDLTVIASKFSPEKFEAEVRAKSAGFVGKLLLKNSSTVEPTLPLLQPLWGEYRSNCGDTPKFIQLQTFRSADTIHGSGNPFGAYHISGQLGQKDEGLCPRHTELEPAPRCVLGSFSSGSYNFFKDRNALTLLGRPQSLTCSVTIDGLECGECKYTRVSNDGVNANNLTWPEEAKVFSKVEKSTPKDGISGDYYGYVFHEYLGIYQAIKMNIVSFQDPSSPEGSLRISAVASAYFGGFDSPEVIDYRFAERAFPLFAQSFILSQPDADLDPVIKVEGFNGESVEGIWYSQLFGRVGPFTLTRNNPAALPPEAKVMQPVAGSFLSPSMSLTIATGQGQSPFNSANPFAPLVLQGHFYYNSGIAPRLPIQQGTYDFYTGRIGFYLEDDDRFAMGATNPGDQSLKVKWIARRFGTIMQPHQPESYLKN